MELCGRWGDQRGCCGSAGGQTDRLRAVHRTIGLALGGNPGSRHATAMGVPISRTTLVHRVRVGTSIHPALTTAYAGLSQVKVMYGTTDRPVGMARCITLRPAAEDVAERISMAIGHMPIRRIDSK